MRSTSPSPGARVRLVAAVRYQGRITDWKDDRGFGFITPNSGGGTVFVHISAFGKAERRPTTNELVTYELVNDGKKGYRAEKVAYVQTRKPASREDRPRILKPLIAALLVAGVAAYGWKQLATNRIESLRDPKPVIQVDHTVKFQCQGKRYCSEMTSCDEATFYLKNCPGVQIDGDRDGIPCEEQWCSRWWLPSGARW